MIDSNLGDTVMVIGSAEDIPFFLDSSWSSSNLPETVPVLDFPPISVQNSPKILNIFASINRIRIFWTLDSSWSAQKIGINFAGENLFLPRCCRRKNSITLTIACPRYLLKTNISILCWNLPCRNIRIWATSSDSCTCALFLDCENGWKIGNATPWRCWILPGIFSYSWSMSEVFLECGVMWNRCSNANLCTALFA